MSKGCWWCSLRNKSQIVSLLLVDENNRLFFLLFCFFCFFFKAAVRSPGGLSKGLLFDIIDRSDCMHTMVVSRSDTQLNTTVRIQHSQPFAAACRCHALRCGMINWRVTFT